MGRLLIEIIDVPLKLLPLKRALTGIFVWRRKSTLSRSEQEKWLRGTRVEGHKKHPLRFSWIVVGVTRSRNLRFLSPNAPTLNLYHFIPPKHLGARHFYRDSAEKVGSKVKKKNYSIKKLECLPNIVNIVWDSTRDFNSIYVSCNFRKSALNSPLDENFTRMGYFEWNIITRWKCKFNERKYWNAIKDLNKLLGVGI